MTPRELADATGRGIGDAPELPAIAGAGYDPATLGV